MHRTHILGVLLGMAGCAGPAGGAVGEDGPGCDGGKCDSAGEDGDEDDEDEEDDDGGDPEGTTGGPGDPDEPTAIDDADAADLASYTADHYDYRIDLDSREASSSIDLTITAPGDCLSIPMRTGAPASVRVDGETVAPEFDGSALRVCGLSLQAGETPALDVLDFEVPLETWRSSQVGYSTSDFAGDFRYGQSWVGQCDRLGPCDSRPDAFATYRFEITHDPTLQVLCPGTIDARETVTICDFDFAGGPTYSTFSFAASDSWVPHDLGMWGDVHVTLYDFPNARLIDEVNVDLHRDFLAWMEDHFGPYPYGDELRIFAAPLFWGGFEHPGNIVMDQGLGGSGWNMTLHHEIAHMWAGNQATLATVHDFFWKESMAEYLLFAFADERGLPSAGANEPAGWKSGGMHATFYPVPLEQPELFDFYGQVYSEGPMVLLRQMEALFGRDAVLEALAMVLGEPRIVGVHDIRLALEATTGASLDKYFNDWIIGAGAPPRPHFDVAVDNLGAGFAHITLTQREPELGVRGCAFALALRGAAGQSTDAWVDLGPDGREVTELDVDVGFPVTSVTFDPHHHCLAAGTIEIAD